jgi:hypothetical protein
MRNDWSKYAYTLADLLHDLVRHENPVLRVVGGDVRRLQAIIEQVRRHDNGNLTDDELLAVITPLLSADASNYIRDEIESVAARAKADIETLRSLVSSDD